ncbi:hypothetical protein H072_9944 [Dactylellina haptotyla CBS 200.50]|uniref:Uncharacterized protein n=1 Tax=Dactylellina haptotyla (strain CBS 200.50) TaxID=1284197 RepID=S8BMT2_DACHA|nr:hypothetical protein H072_9944 [Dactylellina haptotyla CBS 200.50]
MRWKGYGRMNEFEAHESSYDHQHKKRFMEMKQMQRGASSIEARRERERRAEEKAGLITIKPLRPHGEESLAGNLDDATVRVGKKGFKSAFRKGDSDILSTRTPVGFKKAFASVADSAPPVTKVLEFHDFDASVESDTDDESYCIYNPEQPTI